MRRALAVAALGGTAVRPNPLVGCVVADAAGRVLAEGWHKRYGGAHAEVNAVNALFATPNAPVSLAGLRVFVTLEPCAHHGKTPPCADLLIRHGVTEVIVAARDPNPLVAGRGIAQLLAAGCAVKEGVLEIDAQWQNRRFFTNQQLRRPWIVLKWAQSADGFIAGPDGGPTSISHELTRRLVHRWRTEEAAILIGAGTARNDNPHLDARYWSGPAPQRVVLTGAQSLPLNLHVLADRGILPLFYDGRSPKLPAVLVDLLARGLSSVLVEGGATILNEFIKLDLWDELRVITAPALRLGGGVKAPQLPVTANLTALERIATDEVRYYRR
jgi:diaminohydroxyphosphoribosylaminopyrimidine deaminase / 5-amino-6-(5-phosphoribosylamino)uracil reductase